MGKCYKRDINWKVWQSVTDTADTPHCSPRERAGRSKVHQGVSHTPGGFTHDRRRAGAGKQGPLMSWNGLTAQGRAFPPGQTGRN